MSNLKKCIYMQKIQRRRYMKLLTFQLTIETPIIIYFEIKILNKQHKMHTDPAVSFKEAIIYFDGKYKTFI